MPKVSVIIPIYNAEKYLRECLDSVVNQTLIDIEIICVNDGSTDSSLRILEEYASVDDRIKLISQVNRGQGIARNVGIDVSNGRYIFFVDSDDIINVKTLEMLFNKSEQFNLDICVCKNEEINTITNKRKIKKSAINKKYLPNKKVFSNIDIKNNIFQLFLGWPWDKIYKSSLIKDNNIKFPNLKNSEDTYFVYKALIKSDKISVENKVLITHRVNNVNSVSMNRNSHLDAYITSLDLLRKDLIDEDTFKIFKRSYISYFIEFSLWHLTTISFDKREILYLRIKDYLNSLELDISDDKLFIDKYIYQLFLEFKKYDTYSEFSNKHKCKCNLIEKVFSIKNKEVSGVLYKVVTVLGIQIRLKK